ncbi:MAG TPA: malto-oligosyltrehalose trehalohydrolase [Bryobacteraceae bacterium]|jgi:maltooligosyltrehalose trehalohydrolase
MTAFRVWAPDAERLEVRLEGQSFPMAPSEDGWWRAGIATAGHGADYAFHIDGGDALPDPRSPWQPYGVHGASRVVDHARFLWTDAGWRPPPLSSAVIYELHTGTFTPSGTFDSAIERLEHLRRLGVTHIELMPVAEFPGEWGWGYDGVDLFAPHHGYGGPDGLKRFVGACHSAGLAVLLDVVYNHLGPSGNYLSRFGPYFTGRYGTQWGQAMNLDGAGSMEVRRFLCDNALMWLRDYHFDGLRLDAIHAIFDSSAVHFLEELASEVEALEARLGRDLVLIAESDLNDPRVVTPREAGGFGIDAQWSDDFHHALHAVLTGEADGYYADFGSLADLAYALRSAFVYDGRFSVFRNRRHGRKPERLSGSRFLGYLQTHDQIGNRARGERSSQLMSARRLKIGAALVFCSPFIPMLFQGEEFGATTPFQYFTDHKDPDLARAVSEGRLRDFAGSPHPGDVPDPQDPATFKRSKLDWQEMEHEPQASILAWHRKLIELRKKTPDLTCGRLDCVDVQFCDAGGWLTLGRGAITLACNLSGETRSAPVPHPGEIALASERGCVIHDRALELPPESAAIVQHGG